MDRELTFFGIRGKYRNIFFLSLVSSAVVSIILSAVTDMLTGVLLFICLDIASYIGIVILQEKMGFVTLGRYLRSFRFPIHYHLRKPLSTLWK